MAEPKLISRRVAYTETTELFDIEINKKVVRVEKYNKQDELFNDYDFEIDIIDEGNLQKYACEHGIVGFCPMCSEGDGEFISKPASKEALKVLNEKEKYLKEEILRLSTKYHISDMEIIRVCAYLLNTFKKIK